jgi:hypothetical protein
VNIYGLFKVLAFHVPFVFLGIEFLLGGAIPWSRWGSSRRRAHVCGALAGSWLGTPDT